MAETLNKRIQPVLAAEARENARRYWAKKAALAAQAASPESLSVSQDEPLIPTLPKEYVQTAGTKAGEP